MSTGDLVSCVLWLSRLSPASDLSVVKQVFQTARERNASLGLTGAMVFDGESFCQLVEGHVFDISAVYRDVEFDPRLLDLRVLHVAPVPAPRRLTRWRSGYCDGPALDMFSGSSGLQGEAAVAAFLDLLPNCDLSP
jgi:hypothetical protein